MVKLEWTQTVATLTLARVDKHNAFNAQMISDILAQLATVKKQGARALVIRSSAKHFCAGADLAWMKEQAQYSREENLRDAQTLAELFHTVYSLPFPTVALVNGWALGGGAGLACCCDIVLAEKQAQFCFSEAKLGLAPATIAPYVIEKTGPSWAKYLFLTAKAFSAIDAHHYGLVHCLAPADELENLLQDTLQSLHAGGPHALAQCKALISTLQPIDSDIREETATCIAELRTGPEAQEGMQAFFAKRQPQWMNSHD